MAEKLGIAPTLLVIGIVMLLVLNINANRRIARMESQINNLHFALNNIAQDTRSVQGNFWTMQQSINELGEQIHRDARLSFDETVSIRAFNSTDRVADVEVSFYLKERNPADIISITARGQDGQTRTAAATVTGSGRVTAAMSLPLEGNYVFTFTSAGETITTGELMRYNLADRLCGRFSYWMNQGDIGHFAGHGQNLSFQPHFRNDMQGDPALKVTDLTLFIETQDGLVIAAWDLADYLIVTADGAQTLVLPGRNDLSLVIDDETRSVRQDEFTLARLVIRDNLGLRYEVLQTALFPQRFFVGDGWEQAQLAERQWLSDMGRIRIVD